MASLFERSRLAFAFMLAGATACSSSPSPADAMRAREIAHLTPMKATYQNAVTGFDVRNDTTLVLSVDLNQYASIDEDSVAALQAEALKRWSEAWTVEHPHEHATLTVVFIDYHGKPFLTKKTAV
jgi:hypothetical protein